MDEITLESICKPSEDIVSREIEGELIIVPITAGIGDMEDELYTLNETGRAIWDRLDGKTPLGDIVKALAEEYDAPPGDIGRDVQGIAAELVRRRIVIAV